MRALMVLVFILSSHCVADDLTVNPGGFDEFAYTISGRQVSGVSVPYVTPQKQNTPIAFDIFPNGKPQDFTKNTGVAWIDLCHTDILAHGLKTKDYGCLRMGVTRDGSAHIGHAVGGNGVVRDLGLQINGGNIGIGSMDPAAKLDVNGKTIRIRHRYTPPSSSSACAQGEIAWDQNYIYVCISPGRWSRSKLDAW